MKKILTPIALLFAASAFAETEYNVVIDEDTSLSNLSDNTYVTNNATLTLTGDTPRNYSLWIDAGATVSSTQMLKWGTSGGNKENEIEIYGNFYMNTKEFRMGDNDAQWSTTVNIYNGGVLANDANDSGTFSLGNFRGKSSIVNVYTGGVAKGFSIYSFGRNNEQAEFPIFEFNVNGGTANVTSISLGNYAQSSGKIQYSSINVTNGGTMTASSGITVGAAAYNDSSINVSGAGSSFTANANINLNNTSSITLSDGGAFNSTANFYINNGSALISEGGVWNVNTANIMVIGNNSSGTAHFTIDGGTMNQNATNGDLNLYICNSTGSQGNFTITNGGIYQQGSGAKNTQVFMAAGTSVLEISNGGKWFANTNFTVGSNGGNATMILDNGKIASSSGTGYSSDINLATSANSTGLLEVSNGGTADMRTFRMSQGGTNSKSTLILKDAGSYVKANNTNDSNYLFVLGVNSSDSKYSGNSADIFIYTGAQLWNASLGTAWLRDSAQMNFMLAADDLSAADTAMFRTGKLAAYKSDSSVSSPFVIDGANLSYNTELSEGDIVDFTIMNVTGSITFNDVAVDFYDVETLSAMFEFKNNISLTDWEDFDVSNLEWDGANLILSLTYIPEPSTCAAMFGAIALALAAYRRRK